MKKRKMVFRNMFLIVSVIAFLSVIYGCKQPSKNDGEAVKITITVQGDENVEKGKGTLLTAEKGTKWSSVKTKPEITGVAFKDGFELSEWKLNNESGTALTDDYTFNTDTIVFAVSKPIDSGDKVKITVQGDENVTGGKGVSFEAERGILWINLKTHAEITGITFKDKFELSEWKLNNESGTALTDDSFFEEDTVIFAKTHQKAQEVSEGLSMFLSPDKLEIEVLVKTADEANITVEGCTETSIEHNKTTTLHAKSANEAVILKGKITYLACLDNNILSVNVKGCKNMEILNLMRNALTSFDAGGLDKLKYFYISTNNLLSLNLESCTALQLLMCQNNQLSSLDVHDFKDLTTLLCGGNVLTSLNIKGCKKLVKMDCGNNLITSLDTEGCNELTDLLCFNNRLTSVNVKHLTKLKKLNCSGNKLTELDVQGITSLTELLCKENQISSLNVQGCTGLKNLYCYNNLLTEINVQGLNSLNLLYCRDNKLSGLDISNLSNLQYLWISGNKLGAEAFIKIFNDLPSTGGKCIVYTEKAQYTEENVKDFTNPPELKTAFDNAKNKKWIMLKEVTHAGATEEI